MGSLICELRFSFGHLLSNDLRSDLINVDIAFSQLLSQLSAQVISFSQGVCLGIFQDLPVLEHLVLVGHQSLQVLGSKQHKVVVEGAHLLVVDLSLASDQVQKLISRLSAALLLALILLDKLGELRRPGRHCTLIRLLTVVGLRFLLELIDDLVLLSDLEVQLAELIL